MDSVRLFLVGLVSSQRPAALAIRKQKQKLARIGWKASCQIHDRWVDYLFPNSVHPFSPGLAVLFEHPCQPLPNYSPLLHYVHFRPGCSRLLTDTQGTLHRCRSDLTSAPIHRVKLLSCCADGRMENPRTLAQCPRSQESARCANHKKDLQLEIAEGQEGTRRALLRPRCDYCRRRMQGS